jgi:hypothetical protein
MEMGAQQHPNSAPAARRAVSDGNAGRAFVMARAEGPWQSTLFFASESSICQNRNRSGSHLDAASALMRYNAPNHSDCIARQMMPENRLHSDSNDFFACNNAGSHMRLSPQAALEVVGQAASQNLLIVWYESGLWHAGTDGGKKGYEGRDTWATRLNLKSRITESDLTASNLAAREEMQKDIANGHTAFTMDVCWIDVHGCDVETST